MPDNLSNSRIKKLSPLLINQLAAGEVVTRPAAVVKELLENAIDASASNIEIHITQGGMGMIEVMDNGTGIHPDDMVMAITRHATSKVADVANLHGITTLGFRGEALAATAAVSRLTLTSSHDDSGIGRQLQVAGVLDDVPKLIPVVHHRGTTITVKDLYFNVPARRGNLKSIATEFGHIETIVREVALARADVALTLFHDNKKRLSLSSKSVDNNNHSNINRLPLSRLEQATGSSLMDNALEIAIDLSSLVQSPAEYAGNSFGAQASINGWLWPIAHSQDTLPKLIYVNGRLVKEALVSNQLRQLAQSTQLAGIGYALYFDLPTEWLNINVHPSKQRIKISPLNNIMAHLSHDIRTKLKTIISKKTIDSANDDSQVLDNRLPIYNAFAAEREQTSSTIRLTKTQQVQAPRQPYQLSVSKDFSQNLEERLSGKFYSDDFSAKSIKLLSPVSTNNANMLSSSLLTSESLPVCLDIITSLNNLAIESSYTKDIDNKSLPWLLFYYHGQCLLISAADWQSMLSSLFESQVLSNNFSKEGEILEGKSIDSAVYINQQLATVSAQMSAQDLIVFLADIDSLLINNALKTIDSQQLVALMLSSVNKKNN